MKNDIDYSSKVLITLALFTLSPRAEALVLEITEKQKTALASPDTVVELESPSPGTWIPEEDEIPRMTSQGRRKFPSSIMVQETVVFVMCSCTSTARLLARNFNNQYTLVARLTHSAIAIDKLILQLADQLENAG